ncbi:phage tail tape measure protein [Bacillus sp. ISL-7]|uniref:phage tail tape measure protein n=1 Tax=Bacillus sp. ISL-7 TaxID=2819136 RepID=UPI001BE6287E|nr:phage tail tape measure protein [Bacillus sp. ISL-7]MBT2735134.1 phage tail tape measure protein [Bacillus sp. ISL-7]
MAEEIGSLHIDMSLTNAEFKSGMRDVSNRLKIAQSEFKLAGAGLKDFGKSMDGLKAKSKYLEDTLKAQQEKVDFLRRRYEQLRTTQGENAAATQRMLAAYNNAQAGMRTTESRLRDVNEQITLQSSRWHQLGEQLNAAGDRFKAVGGKMQDIGKNLSASVTLPIVGIGAASVKTAMEFEAQMDRVGAIAGATSEDMDSLSKTALDLGANTSKSASEVALGMENMAAMGFTANEVIGAMPGVIAAAEASGSDMAQTADVMASSLNIFSLKATDATKVADILAKTANISAASLTDMQYALKYAGPPAAALGMSLEETSAAIGIMTNAGMDGSSAGTTLRGALLGLLDPSEENSKRMEKMGVAITDSKGNFVGLSKLIQNLTESMDGQTETQKAATISALVGKEAVSGMLSLMKAGPSTIDKMTKSLEDSGGASKEAAAKMKDNLKGAIDELGGTIETAAITIGTTLKPAVLKMSSTIQGLVDKFQKLTPEGQKTILTIAGIAAAVGPVLVITGTLVSSVGTIVTAFGAASTAIAGAGGLVGALTALAGPVGLTIAGVGLVTGAVLAFKNGAKESTNVNLDHTKSLIDQQQSLETLTGKYQELRDKNNLSNYELLRFRDIQSELKTAKSAEEIGKLKDEAEHLREKSGLSNAQLSEMLNLNDKLIEKAPTVGQAFSDQGNKILTNADDLHQANNKLRENIQLELELQKTKAEAKLDQNIRNQSNDIEELNKKVIELNNAKIEAAAKEYQLEALKKQQQNAYAAGQKEIADGMNFQIQNLQQEVNIQNGNVDAVASEVQEKQKAVEKTTEQITKTQALFDEMINLQLAQAGINTKGQEGISQLDQAIKKTVDRKAELLRIQSKYGDLDGAQKKELQNLDGSLDKYRTAKKSIQEIQSEQKTVNKKIDDGTIKAGEMSEVLSASEVKNIKFTGDGYSEAKIISNEANANAKKEINATDYGKTHAIHQEAGKGASKTISIGASISNSFKSAVKAFEKMSGINIPGFARGTRNAPGGLAWVGENGPELTYLPRGAKVIPNRQSEQLLRSWNIPMLANGGEALASGIALVGERGRELVDMRGARTTSLPKTVQDNNGLQPLVNAIEKLASRDVSVIINGREFVRATIDDISNALDILRVRENRMGGVT